MFLSPIVQGILEGLNASLHHWWVHVTQLEIWVVLENRADLCGFACVAPVIPEILSFSFNFSDIFFCLLETYRSLLRFHFVVDFCSISSSIRINWISNTYLIRLYVSWNPSLVLSADPQTYNVKSNSDRVPTIQIDLASPQSPDSVSAIDEFTRANQERQQQEEEDQGLMMKRPAAARGADKSSERDASREQQKLMRCLSDPGPSADEDEDEPFLPWLSRSIDVALIATSLN